MAVQVKRLKYSEDLFKDSTMTFGEHLDELRRCLIMAIGGLLVGVLVGLGVGKSVVQFIQRPLERNLKRNALAEGAEKYAAALDREGAFGPDAANPVEFVERERVVGEEVYVEPRAMLDTLRQTHAAQFSQIELPQNPPGHVPSREGPARFVESDINDARGLARRLLASEPATDPAIAHFARLLGEVERQQLSPLTQGDAPATPDELAALRAVLDRLILRADLFSPESMSHLRLSEEGQRLARQSALLTGARRERFHRLLLEAAFPAEIAATYPQLAPLWLWRPVENAPDVKAKTLNAHEGFMIHIKAALVSGAVLSSPWVFYWIWTFIAAGLYPHERGHVYIFLPFSLGLFFLGTAVAFFFVFDPVLTFLFSYNRWLGLGTDMRISEWMSFVLLLPLGFGVSFQLPLAMLFLERIGIVTVSTFTANWRISILVICFLAMVLTPSDPYSMVLLAGPLTLLYFGGILLCKYMPSRRVEVQYD